MRLKSVTIVTLSTAFNLLLTLGNQVVLACFFGAGTSMDAFLTCGAVPFVVLNVAIGDLGYVLIPLLLQYTGTGVAKKAINSTFTAVLAASVLLTLLGEWQHRAILQLTTSPTIPPATFALAVSMAPIVWGIIGLTVVSSYLTGLHHYYRFFTTAAVTLALPYSGMILGGVFGAHDIGIRAVVWGWFAGTLARTVVLTVTLEDKRPSLFSVWHPATVTLLRSFLPLGLSLLPFVALPSIDVFWASRLPTGSISYLGYSTRIVIALSSLVVQGLSVVIFPDLSEDARGGRLDAVRLQISDAVQLIFALMLPFVVLVFLLDAPFLAVFLQHGRFTALTSASVLRVLPWYLLGTLPMAMMNIICRGYFALRDYRTAALTGLLSLGFYAGLSGALISHYSYVGVGMAYAAFWLLLFVLQSTLLGRKIGALFTTGLLRFTLSLMLSAGAALATSITFEHYLPSTLNPLLCGAVSVVSFVVIYLLLSVLLFRIPQYRMIGYKLLRRVRPRHTPQADFVPFSSESRILAEVHHEAPQA